MTGDQPEPRNRAFLDALYDDHKTALLRFAMSLVDGDQYAAEDIVQETMLRAWKCADSVQAATSPRAWLLAVARRVAVDRWRSRQARPPEVPDTPLQFLGLPDHADATVSTVLVREAVAGLSPKYQAAITEVFLHDRTTREAAARLGVPVGTVKSRLHAAMRNLHTVLDGPAA